MNEGQGRLPLSFAHEMRHALAHGYFKVDLAIVWKAIETDLPALRRQVQALIVDRQQGTHDRAT